MLSLMVRGSPSMYKFVELGSLSLSMLVLKVSRSGSVTVAVDKALGRLLSTLTEAYSVPGILCTL